MDNFAELQAILAGLPMFAVPPSPYNSAHSRSCGANAMVGQCVGCRRKSLPFDIVASSERVAVALKQAADDYPSHATVLTRLYVEHASLDFVCFADHAEERLFTAFRGTDRTLHPLTTPRDLSNDGFIVLGFQPTRTASAIDEYRDVRDRFARYASYGTGHSLGANVLQHLASIVDSQESLRFCRIDAFNTGSSPLRPTPAVLEHTELHVHRVPGDWASMWYKAAPKQALHVVTPKPQFAARHSIGHFLPDKNRRGTGTRRCQSADAAMIHSSPGEGCYSIVADDPVSGTATSAAATSSPSPFLALSCLAARPSHTIRNAAIRDGAAQLLHGSSELDRGAEASHGREAEAIVPTARSLFSLWFMTAFSCVGLRKGAPTLLDANATPKSCEHRQPSAAVSNASASSCCSASVPAAPDTGSSGGTGGVG